MGLPKNMYGSLLDEAGPRTKSFPSMNLFPWAYFSCAVEFPGAKRCGEKCEKTHLYRFRIFSYEDCSVILAS